MYVRLDEMHEGWVRFASEGGRHLYRSLQWNKWVLAKTFDPTSKSRAAYTHDRKPGELPVGDEEWIGFRDGG